MIEKLPDDLKFKSSRDPSGCIRTLAAKVSEIIDVVNELTQTIEQRARHEILHNVAGLLKMLCVRRMTVDDVVKDIPAMSLLLDSLVKDGVVTIEDDVVVVTGRARAELGMGEWPTPEEVDREVRLEIDLLIRFVNGGAMRREDMTKTDHDMALSLANRGLVSSDGAEMWISDLGKRWLAEKSK
jgi:hypothetical protein